MPYVDQMARHSPRCNQYHIDADFVGPLVKFVDQRFSRSGNPAQAVSVDRSGQIGILHPAFHFYKRQRTPSPGYQIGLSSWIANSLAQDSPAMQPQPPRRDRFGAPTAYFGLLAFHFAADFI